MTIRSKLALWYSGLLVTIILILSITVIMVSRMSMLSTIDGELSDTAVEVIRHIHVSSAWHDPEHMTLVKLDSEALFAAPDIAIQVWQIRDNEQSIPPMLIRQSNYLHGNEDAPLDDISAEPAGLTFNDRVIHGIPGRVITHPFPAVGKALGVVQVASPMHAVIRAHEVLLSIVLIAALFSIVVAVLLSIWLSSHITRPIKQLTRAARNIVESNDLATRLPSDNSRDETGDMVRVFNRMMERLEHIFRVQQRFVGDVSHEMRTPLTSIIGHVEIMQRYGADEESLDAVHREAERLARMVNDLLLLARADIGELEIEMDVVDLDTIIVEIYQQALMLKKHRDLELHMDKVQPCRIKGNNDHLRQVLLNLLHNAIKFTPDGGTITLSLVREKDDALIKVKDTGSGIADKDLPYIFDAFFQADSSRRRRHESDGAGLGLSIAERLVQSQGGQIEVESIPRRGTTFKLRFPLLFE